MLIFRILINENIFRMNFKIKLAISTALYVLPGAVSFCAEIPDLQQVAASASLSIADQFVPLLAKQDSQYLRDFKAFEEATNEICKIIGTEFPNGNRPSGDDLHHWVNGIISARHAFKDQPSLGENGMLMRYTKNIQAESLAEETHLACIMAIDGIIKYVIANLGDEDFWKQLQAINPSLEVPSDFVDKVMECINQRTMDSLQGEYETLNIAIRMALATERELICLTRDIFNIYVPVFNYYEFFGYFCFGNFREWEIEEVNRFSMPYLIKPEQLSEAVRPNRERIQEQLQQLFNGTLKNDSPPVLALSRRASITEDYQFIKVQCTYHPSEIFDMATALGVESMSSLTLTFKRKIQQEVRPEILHLLQRPETQLAQTDIGDIYMHQRKEISVFASSNTLISGVQRGVPSAFFFSALRSIDGGDAFQMGNHEAFKALQNARNLGYKQAEQHIERRLLRNTENLMESNQPLTLDCLKWIVEKLRFSVNKEKRESVIVDMLERRKQKLAECLDEIGRFYLRETQEFQKAIPYLKEASDLGYVCAFVNYPVALSYYADALKRNSENKVEVLSLYEQALTSIDSSIKKLIRESAHKDYLTIIRQLTQARVGHSLLVAEYLSSGAEKTAEDLIKAFRILKESIDPDLGMRMYEAVIVPYTQILETINVSYAEGRNGFAQDLEKAKETLAELSIFKEACLEWQRGEEVLMEMPDYDKAINHFEAAYNLGLITAKQEVLFTKFEKAKAYLNRAVSVEQEHGIQSDIMYHHLQTTYDLMKDVYENALQSQRIDFREDVRNDFISATRNMLRYYDLMIESCANDLDTKNQYIDRIEHYLTCFSSLIDGV